MVHALEDAGALRDPRVRKAFLAEPRERYVPEVAHHDGLEAVYRPQAALVTVRDVNGAAVSSASAPSIMAAMLEALDLQPGLRVLEIGTGTGYNAALLRRLVEEAGTVTSVEVDPAIARSARRHLAEGSHRVRVVVGDGRAGWPAQAPFDRIIATASSEYVPVAWRDQLVEGGLVVAPLRVGEGSEVRVVVGLRHERRVLRSTVIFPGGFVPLRPLGTSNVQTASPPSLNASASNGAKGIMLASLSGAGVGRLSAAARRRLLANALTPGRRLGAVPASKAYGLISFLLLHPGARTVGCTLGGRYGAGVIGPYGKSLGAVTCSFGKPGRIEAWGTGAAEAKLCALVDEWQQEGSPPLGSLAITVSYEDSAMPVPKAWRQLRAREGTLSLNWRVTGG